ncbi:MAG: DinB family protein [Dehalococcoidia bacterium]
MTIPAVQQVIDELDAHRERFEALCRSLSEEELARPVPKSTWIVRDFIAHLATIDVPVGEMFRAMHAAEDAGLRNADGGKFEVDGWNDRQVEKRRTLTVDEVLAEAEQTRAELKKHMVVLTEEDLARTMKFGGDSKRPPSEFPFGAYLRGWCKHDPMHALDMSRALPERQAALAPWFDDPVIQGYQKAMNG